MIEADEEDVDVIFEDSVLHQALIDCGFTDLETESKAKMRQDKHKSEALEPETTDSSTECSPFSGHGCFTKTFFSSDAVKQIFEYHQDQALQNILTSGMLLPEDKQFCQDFIEVDRSLVTPPKMWTIWRKPVLGCVILVLTTLLTLSPLPAIISPLLMLSLQGLTYSSSETLLVYTSWCSSLAVSNLLLLLLTLVGVRLFMKREESKILRHIHDGNVILQRLESESWELLHLEKRCLRLLRESEMVARGFTLASQQHHVTLNQKQGQASAVDRLCPSLRRVMLTENKKLLETIQQALVDMMARVSLDVPESSLYSVDDVLASHEMAEDLIAMASLSQSVTLLQVYLSDCFRKLALCFYNYNLNGTAVYPYNATRDSITCCVDAISQAHTTVKKQYSYYRAAHTSITEPKESIPNSAPHQEIGGTTRNLHSFYVCVNSLDLHLQSALISTRDLASTLENLLDEEAREQALCDREGNLPNSSTTSDGQTEENITSKHDWLSWENQLETIKTSLNSLRSCYEESVKQLPRERAVQEPSQSDARTAPVKWTETSHQTPVKMIPAKDPVIVDQVFEAVTDATDEETEEAEWRRQRQQNTREQRVRLQEQREMMKRLRHELGAVVAHRAIAQREREERALARARGELPEDEAEEQDVDNGSQNQGMGESILQCGKEKHINEVLCKDETETEPLANDRLTLSDVGLSDKEKRDDKDVKERAENVGKFIARGEAVVTDGNKRSDLEQLRRGVAAEPLPDTDLKKISKVAEVLPGVLAIELNDVVDAETKSLGQPDVNKQDEKDAETMSDSFAMVKLPWTRPAPPRARRRSGVQYVVPVNLITVGVAVQGASGGGNTGGDSSGDDDRKDKDKPGDGKDGSGRDDEGHGARRKRHVSLGSNQGQRPGEKRRILSSRRRHTINEPCIPEAFETLERHRTRHGEDKKIPYHWARCEQVLIKKRADSRAAREQRARREREKLRQHQAKTRTATLDGSTSGATGPAVMAAPNFGLGNLVPVYVEHHNTDTSPRYLGYDDDGTPDPDLVGGLRFSPDDLTQSSLEGYNSSDVCEGATGWGTHSLYQSGRGSTSSSSQVNLPSAVDPQAEGFRQVGGRYVSRHNFTASDRVVSDNIPALRRFRSYGQTWNPYQPGLLTEYYQSEIDKQIFLNQSAPPESDSGGTDQSPTPELMWFNLYDEDSDDEQWIKITQEKEVLKNGSTVQVIREKQIDIRDVLESKEDPIPSPRHDSSFTRTLAQLVAAHANREMCSGKAGILGGEETFGDSGSDGEEEVQNTVGEESENLCR